MSIDQGITLLYTSFNFGQGVNPTPALSKSVHRHMVTALFNHRSPRNPQRVLIRRRQHQLFDLHCRYIVATVSSSPSSSRSPCARGLPKNPRTMYSGVFKEPNLGASLVKYADASIPIIIVVFQFVLFTSIRNSSTSCTTKFILISNLFPHQNPVLQ
jgi:hypothetical protein